VGDLRLEALWTPAKGGEGGIKLTLGRPNNCYQVRWDASGVTLGRYDEASEGFQPVAAKVLRKMAAPRAEKGYRLALNNVDHAAAFFVDGEKVLEFAEPWSARQAIVDVQDHPADWTNAPGMAEQSGSVNTMIRIDVDGSCDLSHLKLYRDLYYTQVTKTYQDRWQWKGTATQNNPLTLGDDEFFAMGDNSRQSNDGRLWSRVYAPLSDLGLRPGIVPRRFLLGKAFYVYWPAGFRVTDAQSVPWLSQWPIGPNTGDMRAIR
jgi:hypothetical protein